LFLLCDVALNHSQNFAGRIMLLSGDTGNCKCRKIKRKIILPEFPQPLQEFLAFPSLSS
jgi:hypothetical protein